MAKTKNIHVLAFPPHTTSWLQPIDGKVVGPFSKAFNKACSEFLSDSPGIIITKDQRHTVINFHFSLGCCCYNPNIKAGFKAYAC